MASIICKLLIRKVRDVYPGRCRHNYVCTLHMTDTLIYKTGVTIRATMLLYGIVYPVYDMQAYMGKVLPCVNTHTNVMSVVRAFNIYNSVDPFPVAASHNMHYATQDIYHKRVYK